MTERREKNITRLLYVIAVLIPCIFLVLWYLIQGHGFLGAKPYYSDELGYWRCLFSFKNCGFSFGSGGGFAGAEAPVGPLGSHGLSPIFAWGWYALIFPWKDNSIFAADFIMLTVSIAVFLLLVRPDRRKMLLIIPALLLYAPIALYINTAMMEISCMSAVIIYSGLYLRWREKREKAVFAAAIFMGIYLGVLRICYVAVLLPLLWEKWDFKLNIKTLLKLALFAAGAAALYVVSSLFITPYPLGFVAALSRTPTAYKPAALISHFISNIRAYFASCLLLNAESAFKWLYLAVLVYFLCKSIMKGGKKRLYLSMFLVYAAHLGAQFLLYDVTGWLDYRTMSPVLIMAILFIIMDEESKKSTKAAMLVLIALTFVFAFRSVIRDGAFVYNERFEKAPDNKAAFTEVFGEDIASVATMSEDGVFDRVKDIPPQIGVKWMNDDGGVISSDTAFIMIGGDDREVSDEYEFVGMPAEKCYVYKRNG